MARELLEALDQAGVRLTGPRRELAALIARRQGHFTAADLLADQNLVERVDLPDGRHAYVPCEPSHHHHLVCVSCGAISEVDDCGIDAVTAEAARRSGFEIQSHRLELFGRCPRCQNVEPRQ